MPATKSSDDKPTWESVWAEQRDVGEKLDLLAAAVGQGNPDAKKLKEWSDNQKQVAEPAGNPADVDAKTE